VKTRNKWLGRFPQTSEKKKTKVRRVRRLTRAEGTQKKEHGTSAGKWGRMNRREKRRSGNGKAAGSQCRKTTTGGRSTKRKSGLTSGTEEGTKRSGKGGDRRLKNQSRREKELGTDVDLEKEIEKRRIVEKKERILQSGGLQKGTRKRNQQGGEVGKKTEISGACRRKRRTRSLERGTRHRNLQMYASETSNGGGQKKWGVGWGGEWAQIVSGVLGEYSAPQKEEFEVTKGSFDRGFQS